MKFLSSIILMAIFVSCIEPEKTSNIKKQKKPAAPLSLKTSQTTSALAIKNFLQVNNTYSQLTGISPSVGNIASEYQAIQLQLPSSTDPETLNGFNQIAATRLAFAYCNEYIDVNEANFDFATVDTNEAELKSMALDFVDLDFSNSDHQDFLSNLIALARDDDDLVEDANFAREKRKLMKMSCAGILSSTYVTLF